MNKWFKVVILLLSWQSVYAETSKEYAIMGMKCWHGYVCSVLASKMENEKEHERLFTYAYKNGRTFIEAIQNNKITQQDYSNNVPLIVNLNLQGPSVDFMLGRIYEHAVDSALEGVILTDGEINDYELQKVLAQGKYEKSNCMLIGD